MCYLKGKNKTLKSPSSHLGFYGVFGICALLNLINLVYLSQWVKESFVLVKPRESGEQSLRFRELLVDFFRWTHIQTTIKFAFSRVGDRRQRIFVSSLLVLFAFAPIYGEFDIVYLFVRRKFHWNIAEFSLYLTMSSLVAMIGEPPLGLRLNNLLFLDLPKISSWPEHLHPLE